MIAAYDIINLLREYAGFSEWWDDIHPNDQRVIIDHLRRLINEKSDRNVV